MTNKPRVLLVDDHPMILSTYRRTLQQSGAEILLAEGPTQALGLLERQPIEVVLSDYQMPGMKGDVFLEQVRDRWPRTVRILITAYTDVHIVEDVVRRGAIFRFLTKPCSPEKLKSAIGDAIEETRRARDSERLSRKAEFDLLSYKHLFWSAPDPMMIADLDGNVLEVNEAFILANGASRADALRLRPHILTANASTRFRWARVRDQVLKDKLWSREVSHDGQRHSALSISAIKDDRGNTYAVAAIERDVTTRRRLEHASRAAQYEVILAMARLAEYRDPETGAHLERMRRYSQVLARQLSRQPRHRETIDREYVESIFFSSPLHDVGKVGIPDAILLKDGRLTEDEWATMKTHATIGGEILSAAGDRLPQRRWLAMARVIALQHHERFDGTGYPAGLVGDAIDQSARIVTLADAYDAITSKRVYKDALPHDEARRRIVESSGSHFDPDVVVAFLAAQREFLEIKQCFADVGGVGG